MHLKPQKIIFIIMTVFIMTSMNMNINAETLLDETLTYDSESAAYINYDPESNTYELIDGSGLENDTDAFYSTEETISAETTVDSEISEKTTVTSLSPAVTAVTVTKYKGRLRAEATTTTTTTTTTTKATTTTKKTTVTTTKKVYDGIDVSRHQGNIDWTKVKAAGIEFVMIRAGYGMEYDQVDANFHKNIKAAQAAGLECGVYWYSYAVSTSEALKEAQVCYDTIKGYKLSYPVSFDFEDPSQDHLSTTAVSNITKIFCEHLESKKYYVSVYSYASLLKDKMNSSVLSSYDIWVAHTGVSKPSFTGNYGMWQYSHTGKVNGITGNVDLDYSYKYYPAIMKNNKLNGYG